MCINSQAGGNYDMTCSVKCYFAGANEQHNERSIVAMCIVDLTYLNFFFFCQLFSIVKEPVEHMGMFVSKLIS